MALTAEDEANLKVAFQRARRSPPRVNAFCRQCFYSVPMANAWLPKKVKDNIDEADGLNPVDEDDMEDY